MKIESPNASKIIVELSDEDMTMLDITYEELDYSNIDTRRVIWTILAKARKLLGRDIDPSGKMTIETLPCAKGGCIILFTVPDMGRDGVGRLPVRMCSEKPVYEFRNIDDVIDLYSCLRKMEVTDCLKAGLYYDGKEKYRLVFERIPDVGGIKNRVREYALFCGQGSASVAHTKEYWGKVCSDLFH